MEAISDDEDAAAAAGVNVTAEKLKITLISALMTALAGALYCQYQMFISPDTVSGISVSLQMVFAVIVGGLYVSFGPTVGAIITILLAEILRIGFGTKAVGWDNLVYGVLLVLFIIFLPKGILGSVLDETENDAQETLKPNTQAAREAMSKKSSQPLADSAKALCRAVSFRRRGRVSPEVAQDQREGRPRQGQGRKNHRGQSQAAERFPGKALRAGPLVAAPDLPGHGRRRQGLRDQERVRRCQSAGLRSHLVQAAVDQGTRSRFPVAQHDRAAGTRPDRHLQPLLLRGMSGGAGASGGSRQGKDTAVIGDQKYLARAVRGYLRDGALPRAQRHRDPEILPQCLQGRTALALPRPAGRAREELEVLAWPIFPSARCGRNIRPPIRK